MLFYCIGHLKAAQLLDLNFFSSVLQLALELMCMYVCV